MDSDMSRRKFLAQLGGAAAAIVPFGVLKGAIDTQFWAKSPIKLGCAAITWGDNITGAIEDISSLGFKGTQLRANAYTEYSSKPQELKKLLTQHKLQFPLMSSGNVEITLDADQTKAQTEKHVQHAKLVKAMGGEYIQVVGARRTNTPTSDELKKFSTLLSETGKRVADEGITVVYHNHMHAFGETPEEIDQIMDTCDTRYVKFLLDIAHCMQGGGEPVKFIQKYGSIMKVMHIKDVKDATDANGKKSYQFVELGRGRVNFGDIFAALEKINYKEWAIIELDSVPDKSRTPLEATKISRDYLKEKLKLSL